MVDPSLLRQAADRGVTIAFADLDGADGLWVPEERTVLVNRGLSDAAVAEVIEHELTHVAIDDQHADLDAGREVLVGKPPPARTGPAATVAAGVAIIALVGGVAYGVNEVASRGDRADQVVGPAPPGLTAEESGGPQPSTTVVVTRDAQGRVVTRTITLTPPGDQVRATASLRAPTPSPTRAAGSARASTAPRSPAAAEPTATRPAPTTPAESATATATATPTASSVPPTPSTPVEPGEGGGEIGGGGDVDTGTEAGTEGLTDTGPATAGLSTGPVTTPGN